MDLDPTPDAPFPLCHAPRVPEAPDPAIELDGGQERLVHLRTLSARLFSLYTAAGDTGDLETAVVHGLEGDHADRCDFIGNLATALWTRFERRGNTDDLHKAIKHSEHLRMTTPVRHPTHLLAGLFLASSLYTRYKHTEEQDDLRRAECLDALARHLLARFWLVEVREDLENAVARGEEAVLRARGTSVRVWYLESQAGRLRYRYGVTGAVEDLQRAAAMVEEAAMLADETIRLARTV